MAERLTHDDIERLRETLPEWHNAMPLHVIRIAEHMLRLHDENQQLTAAIRKAISHANGRQCEWGERAEVAFDFLFRAVDAISEQGVSD